MNESSGPERARLADARLWARPPGVLVDALRDHEDPEGLLRTLILISVPVEIDVQRDEEGTRFLVATDGAPRTPGDMLLSIENDGSFTGRIASEVELTYQIVRGFEGVLSAVDLLPPGVRNDRINEFCDRIGVSRDRYQDTVRHWVHASSKRGSIVARHSTE
jgi:hypothetical protein